MYIYLLSQGSSVYSMIEKSPPKEKRLGTSGLNISEQQHFIAELWVSI